MANTADTQMKMKVKPGPREKPKPDLTKRPEEITQFDVLDGPFANFFHRFVKRRMLTSQMPKPYPWFIGGIHRLARMLDVADHLELVVLGGLPFAFVGFYSWRWFGIPSQLAGLGELAVGCYVGYWFVLMVFLDRRLDHLDLQRVKSVRYARVEARDTRVVRRREAAKNLPALRERAAEARERGRAKATDPAPEPPATPLTEPRPDAAMAVSLEDLLDRG